MPTDRPRNGSRPPRGDARSQPAHARIQCVSREEWREMVTALVAAIRGRAGSRRDARRDAVSRALAPGAGWRPHCAGSTSTCRRSPTLSSASPRSQRPREPGHGGARAEPRPRRAPRAARVRGGRGDRRPGGRDPRRGPGRHARRSPRSGRATAPRCSRPRSARRTRGRSARSTINWTYGPAARGRGRARTAPRSSSRSSRRASRPAPLSRTRVRPAAFDAEHLARSAGPRRRGRPGDHERAAVRASSARGRSPTSSTGIRNRSGYELELEREVARAHRTGRPLSLLVVELRGSGRHRALRGRRRRRAPGVRDADQAHRADDRHRLPATRVGVRGRPPGDEGRGRTALLDAPGGGDWHELREERAEDVLGGPRRVAAERDERRPRRPGCGSGGRGRAAVGCRRSPGRDRARSPARADGRGSDRRRSRRPARAPARASRRSGRGREHVCVARCTVVAAHVEVEDGESAAALRAHVAARVDDALDEGSAVSWVEPDGPALMLPGATAADAQALVAVLQASLDVRPPRIRARPRGAVGRHRRARRGRGRSERAAPRAGCAGAGPPSGDGGRRAHRGRRRRLLNRPSGARLRPVP